MKEVAVIGAGIGGLTTAIRLASLGLKVSIFEKNDQAGGRLNIIEKDGFKFDTGPTFFSMSYVFEEFQRDCNVKLPFKYERLENLYLVDFSGKEVFRISSDPEKLFHEFSKLEPNFMYSFRKYLDSCKKLFDVSFREIVMKNHDNLIDYVNSILKNPFDQIPKLFRSFYQELSIYFKSETVKNILSLVAFFLGNTPFNTSAVYNILSYVEFEYDGYHRVHGGMYEIVRALLKVIEKLKIKIIYGTEIVDAVIKDNKIEKMISRDGKEIKADIFVVNMDAALFRSRVLKRRKFSDDNLRKMKWTFAPLTIYLGVQGKIDYLDHHNYFVEKDYYGYASRIFRSSSIKSKPYYYVNLASKYDLSLAPEGCEAISIVCPMPDKRYKPSWEDSEEIVEQIIDDLSKRINFNIKDRIRVKIVYTPDDWESMFNLYMGSGLGLSHDLTQMGYFRPSNKDEHINNLFYVGASTVPGTGIPMCVISSKLVCERIKNVLSTI